MEHFTIEISRGDSGLWRVVVVDAEGNRAEVNRVYRTKRGSLLGAAVLIRRMRAWRP